MKIDLKKLAKVAISVATPVVTAVVVQRMTTGKIDVKGAVLAAAGQAIANAQAKR